MASGMIWPAWLIVLFVIAAIWSAIWKFIALWRSARNNQKAWFVVMAIFSTLGLLEIIYLAFLQQDNNPKNIAIEAPAKPVKKKK
jgi:hypothetical protein